MRLQCRISLLAVLFLTITLTKGPVAQTTTSGGLSGVVTDQSGAVLPTADVEIKDDRKGTAQSTKTDREGVYRFFFLPPSAYMLTVTHSGFRKETRAVNVLLGPSGTVNVTLEIAQASSEVTVTADAPLIQAENGDSSTTMTQKQISEVPNPGNDLTYIVQTAPGVIMNTDSQITGGIQAGMPNFSILGMPGTSYHVTLDGMSITENGNNFVATGSLGLVLGQNQIQETTVVTTGYSGQFGEAAGGNINYVTKSGGNAFHGNAQYYWNGSVLNANDWFFNAFDVPRPFSIANQWAGSFGGPIKKDRLFFFVDTEGLRLSIPAVLTPTIPSPDFEAATIANIDSRFGAGSSSDTFYRKLFNLFNMTPGATSAIPGGFDPNDPTGCTGFVDKTTGLGITKPCAEHFIHARGVPSQDALGSGRLDWNLSNSDRLFFRIQGEQGRGAFYTDPINPVFDAAYNVWFRQGQIVETHSFNPTTANQFLFAGTAHSFFWATRDPAQAFAALPTDVNFGTGVFQSIGPPFGTGVFGSDDRTYQLSDDVVKIWGRQKWGFGATLARIDSRQPPDTGNSLGTLTPQTLRAFYQGGMDPATPSIDFTQLSQAFTSQTTISLSFNNFGFYGQDEWNVRPGLSLTFGFRAEHYSNPLCNNHCFSRPGVPFESLSHDPTQPYNQAILTNQGRAFLGVDSIVPSPRFSFAWQPFGVSHNSVLHGGLGIFYDPLRVAVSQFFSTNAPNYNVFNAFSGNLAPGETNSLFQTTNASNAAFVQGFNAGDTLAQMQAAVQNFAPPSLAAAGKNMHLPQYQRWSLEWQQAIGAHTSVSVGYFGHHGIHEMYLDPNANAFGFGTLPHGPCSSPPVPPCSDPRFSGVTQFHSDGVSNFNGLVTSFRHQFTRLGSGLVQVNYTFSHAFDEISNGGVFGFTAGSSINPQDPANLRGAYGPAEYDVRHSLNGNYVWELPVKAALGGRGPDYLVKGWQVAGTFFARTGSPYTLFDQAESNLLQQNNYFGRIYAVPAGPLPASSSCGEGAAVTNPISPCLSGALFVQPNCETGFNTGNLPGPSGPCSGPAVSFAQGRNRFRGPGYVNTDLAITKITKLPQWENATLGIGLQFFNVLNHPNFGFPDNISSDPTFGQILYLQQPPTSILGSGLGGDAAPRMIQLKAQLQF